jgi:hypothetical protein
MCEVAAHLTEHVLPHVPHASGALRHTRVSGGPIGLPSVRSPCKLTEDMARWWMAACVASTKPRVRSAGSVAYFPTALG